MEELDNLNDFDTDVHLFFVKLMFGAAFVTLIGMPCVNIYLYNKNKDKKDEDKTNDIIDYWIYESKF
jgi:hypothetical protein